MGYVRGLVHGVIIGSAVALLYAPKPGRQLRDDLSDRLDQVRGQMQPVIDQAQGVVDAARPQVERGISKAQQQAQRITRRGSESSGSSAYGCLLYTSPSPRDLSTSRMPSSA